jgi:hypothetical protein
MADAAHWVTTHPDNGRISLPITFTPMGLQFGFNQRLDFLNHHHLLDHCRQLAAFLERHRAGETQLQHRRIREGFLDVHVGRAGGDKADALVRAILDEIQWRSFGQGAQLFDVTLEHQRNTLAGIARHHDETRPALF